MQNLSRGKRQCNYSVSDSILNTNPTKITQFKGPHRHPAKTFTILAFSIPQQKCKRLCFTNAIGAEHSYHQYPDSKGLTHKLEKHKDQNE